MKYTIYCTFPQSLSYSMQCALGRVAFARHTATTDLIFLNCWGQSVAPNWNFIWLMSWRFVPGGGVITAAILLSQERHGGPEGGPEGREEQTCGPAGKTASPQMSPDFCGWLKGAWTVEKQLGNHLHWLPYASWRYFLFLGRGRYRPWGKLSTSTESGWVPPSSETSRGHNGPKGQPCCRVWANHSWDCKWLLLNTFPVAIELFFIL